MPLFLFQTRSSGDLAGVLEEDGGTLDFYLYRVEEGGPGRIYQELRLGEGDLGLAEADLEIAWDAREELVGLRIRGTLWAAFDVVTGEVHGGRYARDTVPWIPRDIAARLSR
ncbi:MAG TPA: hypothetical protein VHE35_05380 [Kofleriaceae bacterium]|nr:hypothetical protein [Kofleriaceae bacterium]